MARGTRDYLPTISPKMLKLRARLLEEVRRFFRHHDFLEVETPMLSADTVVDRHLDPFPVPIHAHEEPEGETSFWLQTSPELAMKRLLASGAATAIFQITHAFRQGERGRLHNPEFTMVEWYRAGDTVQQAMSRLADLTQQLLRCPPVVRLSYAEAFQESLQVDPHTADAGRLREAAKKREIEIPSSFADGDRDSLLHLLLVEVIEPELLARRPTLLYDFPASQAALACVRDEQPPVAERFELYVGGVELANGYHELLDASELRARIRQQNNWRQRDGKDRLPENNRLLPAMEAGLPPCCGVALGFDRLVMLASGAESIDEVIPFPIERA